MTSTLRDKETPPAQVLSAFRLDGTTLTAITTGLINRGWFVRTADGVESVLQRVNPIFAAEVNDDIAAVTTHLAGKGLITPRLLTTTGGAVWLRHDDHVWRVLTRIPGYTLDAITESAQAREAGRILGRFHDALADFDAPFRNARLGVHDTAAHLQGLRETLIRHRDHANMPAVLPLADRLLMMAERLPAVPATPDRVVHGDPKISNIVFEHGSDRALCLVDLDTLSRMPVALELGDAVRSWCNPATEDTTAANLSMPLFKAAMQGYATTAKNLLTRAEITAIPDAAFTIALELAVRFCADALNENYFAWDAGRFTSAGAHNLARAVGQLALAESLRDSRDAMTVIVADAFGIHRHSS